ncbi:ketopantoate reductase family protein [Pseudonocardia sp. TRM90224]|uniref:ketopantoate reductase family protein n=1 Tax=Pseudonocardia sp. TRM90224 TaxID=2812678 RepID=UPI001E317751|nr:2-dehydropantoate 2-reductase N-terminal domain-containing protein [Pseudonocardia sp. TRM90224]
MRYVVVGAGAIGGTIGGRLHEAGREVVLVARGAHLDALRLHGLRLDEPGRSRTLRIPAVAHVTEIDWRPGDVVLLCTKSQHSVAVLDDLSEAAPDTPVVCVQNGVANERFAANRFAEVQSICVMLPAEHLTPGRVVAYSAPCPGVLDIGRYPSGADELTMQIAGDLTAAGFSSEPTPSIMPWKYRKLLLNLGNAAEAACGPGDPGLPDLVRAAVAEGEQCLTTAGIDVVSQADDVERRGDLISMHPVDGEKRQGGSTWQSLQRATGSTEAEFLTGEIVAIGRRVGVPTPVNTLLLGTAVEMAADNERPGSRDAAQLLAAVPV